MRKDEYINEVISKIENKKARREVEKELSAHIDDRISYYTDAGYEEEISNTKALEMMGEPGKVGIQMAKLHKKNKLAIILISIAIALVLTFIVLLFTTPLSAYYFSYKYDKMYNMPSEEGEEPVYWKDTDWFYVARKCGPFMNLVYKINPSINNLDVCHSIYGVTTLKYGLYYKNTVPKDFEKYCIKYAELMYNSEPREEWNSGWGMVTAIPMIPNYEIQYKIGNGIDYALALYLDGQVEESKKVIEDCIALVGDNEDFAVMYSTMKTYFYYVYTSTEDKAVKDWIDEKVKSIDETCKGMKKYEKHFSRHDSMYKFPPSFEEYMDGTWQEYAEINYDDMMDSISQQINIFAYTNREFDEENTAKEIADITMAEFVGDIGKESHVLKYKYDERLSFEIYDMPVSHWVFYLDGREYRTVEFGKQ